MHPVSNALAFGIRVLHVYCQLKHPRIAPLLNDGVVPVAVGALRAAHFSGSVVGRQTFKDDAAQAIRITGGKPKPTLGALVGVRYDGLHLRYGDTEVFERKRYAGEGCVCVCVCVCVCE